MHTVEVMGRICVTEKEFMCEYKLAMQLRIKNITNMKSAHPGHQCFDLSTPNELHLI